MTHPIADMPPNLRARIAGAFYVITIAASALDFMSKSSTSVYMNIAGAAYIGVTVLFYYVFKPVPTRLHRCLQRYSAWRGSPSARLPTPCRSRTVSASP